MSGGDASRNDGEVVARRHELVEGGVVLAGVVDLGAIHPVS
jgi:hypothetical protein